MGKHVICCATAIMIGAICLSSRGNAGQLFPPANMTATPASPCPNSGVLSWLGGSVDCVDPTAGVTVSCPSGQVLNGINKGSPVCVALIPTAPAPAPSTPPGTVIGGGSCVEAGATGCPANTWSFWGVGQPGGCSGGAGIVYTQMGSYPETMNWPVAYNCITQ